eukprot:1632937-Prymnesium_polylepis.1
MPTSRGGGLSPSPNPPPSRARSAQACSASASIISRAFSSSFRCSSATCASSARTSAVARCDRS